jgi:hypothetical protein
VWDVAKVFRKDLYYKETGYVPHPGQLTIHNDRSRFKVVSNGRRWGKTYLGAKEVEPCAFVESRAITGGPQLGWIVGPQYTDTEKEYRIVYDQFRKLGIDKDAIKFVNNPDNGALHMKTDWGFELVGKSAKHPETLVGEGLDFVLMVEAGRHRRRTWGQYIRPALSDKRGWALFTGVPEGKSEHSLLYALWQRGQSTRFPSWASWRMPSWTNTIIFPGGRQDSEILEAESDLTDDEFRRQYGAEFVEHAGAVMSEWDDELHLRDLEYNPDWPLYGAVDYGFTNPFVWLWVQVDTWGGVHVIGERRWERMDTLEVAQDMLARDGALVRNCTAFYPDPAEPDDTLTLEKTLKIGSRKNTGGELKTRLSLIRTALKEDNQHLPYGHVDRQPKLKVDRSCTQLAWEMREGYRWPEHRSEVKSDSEHPLDKDNHGVEALGRFFRGYFGMPGQDMKPARSRVRAARMG